MTADQVSGDGSSPAPDRRVLVLAASRGDAEALRFALSESDVDVIECATAAQLAGEIRAGACAAILAAEVVDRLAAETIAWTLLEEPRWSDFPLIIVTRGDFPAPVWWLLEHVGIHSHAITLERPIRSAALVTAVRTAKQSRMRQYQIRDELAGRKIIENALRESEGRLLDLNATLEARVTERTRQLQFALERLRKLAQELTDTEQRERRKLARMLHDGLQQILVAIKMQLSLFGKGVEWVPGVQSLIAEAIGMSRTLAHEMNPPILNDSDILSILRWIARQFAENHRFDVTINLPAQPPEMDQDVKSFVFHAVREMLLNAVKHSGATGATVALTEADNDCVRVEVSDVGKGFDAEMLDEKSEVGLGLLSVRERARAMNGSLAIDSFPGRGTRLTLLLPRSTVAAVPAAPESLDGKAHTAASRAEPGAIRVLVVDDHTVVRQGIVAFLEREGFSVVGQAANGVEAIERTGALAPDVVVMDINMPRMDGIEATRVITGRDPRTKVIGLSLWSDPEKAAAMREAGAVAYVLKDADLDPLIATIRDAV